MKRLSIIIVTFNSEEHIFDCVGAVKKWADLPHEEVELIVVDNKSSEVETMFEGLKQLWGDDIILIRNTVNGGYGQGNNLGIARASAPIALIMNPDVRLYEPILQQALEQFDSDKRIGLLGMVQMGSATKRSNHSFYPTWMMNGYMRYALYILCNRLDYYMPSCMSIQGSCFFVRREMFLSVGGFDETNFMYGEEDDLYYRLRAAYGASCFAFNKHLHYIHLHQQQPPSLEHEQQLLQANIALYTKRGIRAEVVVRHFLQANRLLLIKEGLKNKRSERYNVLRAFRQFLLKQE